MKSNILLQGEIGGGKTRCLITLLPEYVTEDGEVRRGAGLSPFLISMEPGAEATLGANLCVRAPKGGRIEVNNPIHHHYIPPGTVTWEQSRQYVLLASRIDYEALLKTRDPNRASYDQLLQLYATCADFVCDGCGEHFGAIDTWGPDRAIALDGLTGLTKASRMMWLGARPVVGKNDYQPIQGFIEGFLDNFYGGTNCTSILISHLDRRDNELTGISEITLDTAGPALVRRLIKKPDEIITCERNEKGVYRWNTLGTANTVNKKRRLPEAPDLTPDFTQLFT